MLFSAPVALRLRDKLYGGGLKRLSPLWDACYAVLLLLVVIVSDSYVVKGTYNPFIYFNF